MAGTKINDYAVGQDKWDELLTTIEKQRKGFIALSLTNYDNNSEPAIAAGSYIEISGALYGFTSEESINGTPSSGDTNYIYIDTTDLKPYWTTTAPTWGADKNGWYDSTETDRYIGGCYYDGTNYTGKWVYDKQDSLTRGTQTIYGVKTFNDEIYDKNGNEVVAMQIETKRNTTNYDISPEDTQDITVSGFSFNPTAVLNLLIRFGTSSSGDPGDRNSDNWLTLESLSGNNADVEAISFGTNSVTITVRNTADNDTPYYHVYIKDTYITAART